jgi:hypothetical protein
MEIVEESPYRFVIPRHGRMLVPGVVFTTRALIPDPATDRSLEQVVNVAELPGIVEPSYAMPYVPRPMSPPAGSSHPAESVSTSPAACDCSPPISAGRSSSRCSAW